MGLAFDTDEGFGTLARLGLVVLQADETIEQEFAALLPRDGVALYHSRIVMPAEVNAETLASMEAELPRSARMLPDIEFDVIGFCCTSGATIIGPDGVAAAIGTVHPEAKVTDPVTAVLAACRAFGIGRIGFVTPYVAEVSAAMRSLLEANGLSVAAFASFEEGDDRIVARISPTSVADAIRHVDSAAECDAVFVSCTNLRVAGIAGALSREIGKPVLSSNTALCWHMMTLAGVAGAVPGLSDRA